MILLGKVFKKRSYLIVLSIALLLFTSLTMNAEATPFVTSSESDLIQVNTAQEEPIDPNDSSKENSDGESVENDIPTNSSDMINPLKENNIILEKSAFNIKSYDQELLGFEIELLKLRKKAAEDRNNISIEIYMKYFELRNENVLLHDFKEAYDKGNESKYAGQMNSYYVSKEQEFINLIQKYQDAIVQYSNALNVPLKTVDKNLLSLSSGQSEYSPITEDIQINRSILTNEQVISVTVAVYHVQDDQLKNESETDVVNTDQLKKESEKDVVNTDQLKNESETDVVNTDQLKNESETDVVNTDPLKNENETDVVNNDQLIVGKTIIYQEEYKDIHSGEDLNLRVKRDPSITEGYYLVELKYSDPLIPTEYLRYEAATIASISSNVAINTNQSIDVSLGAGITQVYEFTATKAKSHRVFTGPYAGVGGSNDTVLEIYSDAALTNLIASNDDYNGASFSSITFVPNAGQKYYIKLRTYSNSASLYCRITMLLPEPIVFSETSAQYVYNTSGSLMTVYYGSGRQMIYLYDNNGNLLRKVLVN